MRKILLLIIGALLFLSFLGCNDTKIVTEKPIINVPQNTQPNPSAKNNNPQDLAQNIIPLDIDPVDLAVFKQSPKQILISSLPAPLDILYLNGENAIIEHSIERQNDGNFFRKYELSLYGGVDIDKIKNDIADANLLANVVSDFATKSSVISVSVPLQENTNSVLIDETLPADGLPDMPLQLIANTPIVRSVFVSSNDEKLHFSRTWHLSKENFDAVAAYYMPIMNSAKNSTIENVAETDTRLTGEFSKHKLIVNLIFYNNTYIVETEIIEL